ncbi:MAG: hypothetical protein AAF943_08935 [Pseudomonadota bacterium]
MTGFGYPEMMRQVIGAFHSGDTERARDIFGTDMPMIRYEAQPGQGLAMRNARSTRGHCTSGTTQTWRGSDGASCS